MRKLSRFCATSVAIATVATIAAASPASSAIIGVTSATGLGANDSIDWGQLGSSYTVLVSPFTVTSAKGVSVTVSPYIMALQQEGGGARYGGFSSGEWLVGPEIDATLTLAFSKPVFGVGAQIDSVGSGPFTANIIGSNGAVLGSFSEGGTANNTGVADSSDIFIGLKSATADITSIEFTSSLNGQGPPCCIFAVGRVSLVDAVPEPAGWTMLLVGFGGLGLATRGSRRRHAA